MKKLLTLLLALMILAGCGQKAPTWESIKEEYDSLKQDVINITENSDSFLKNDYLNAIGEIKSLVTNLEKSTEETNTDKLQKIYKLVYSIQTISANYTGVAAKQINAMATIVDALIESVYDGSEQDFDANKQEVLDKLNELEQLPAKQWLEIEKKVALKWEEVETEYEKVIDEAKDEMTDAKEVSEAELDDLKDDIIENYENIAYGVSVFNQDIAKQIYADAIKLEAYAKKTSSDEGKTVKKFAQDTISYVKKCYGKQLSEDEALSQDYELSIEAAKKWTQSVWNIITTELKI